MKKERKGRKRKKKGEKSEGEKRRKNVGDKRGGGMTER